MKVSKSWLKELVQIDNMGEVVRLLPLRTIAIKADTPDYIELDMKGYNRADLLSMRGVAYEVAAIIGSQSKFEESEDFAWSEQNLAQTPVSVNPPDLCPLQGVAKIERLKVGESPSEWKEKLAACGMRSVNNIADITNLIMLEYGQPLHSFDADTVKDDVIDIRLAKDGEEITTLDGKTRRLTSKDMVLSDKEKALDVAGVMGGKETEIKDGTTNILLSASLFNPEKVRQTSNRLKLGSEASKRFYHGLTKKRLLQAFDAAIKMYQSIGGELTALNIVGDREDKTNNIVLTKQKTDSLIGVEIPKEEIEKYLIRLGFQLEGSNVGWLVTPPYFRLDIAIEEDLIEEVARMYGYERIPAKKLEGEFPSKIDQSIFELIGKLKTTLVELGLTEVQTYSFASTAVLKNLGWMEGDNLKYSVKVENPISAETEYLRQHLWSNLVEVISKNLKYNLDDYAIFEVGKAYYPTKDGPKESYRLSLALLNGTDNPIDELNSILEELIKKTSLNIQKGDSQKEPFGDILFHPTRFLNLISADKQVGGMAEVHPKILNKFGIEKRVAVLELDLESIK